MEHVITYRGIRLFYKTAGKGTPVFLIHGFGEDSSVWEGFTNSLQPDHYLIMPDIPGSGRSDRLTGDKISMNDYAACLKEIMEVEGIATAIMIGHSMGGYITLAFAEMYPECLSCIGLFHSSAYSDDIDKIVTRKKAIAFIQKNGTAAFLETSIPGLFKDTDKNREEVNSLLEKGNSFSPAALIQYYEAMISRPDRTSIIRNTNLPVLFIMGMYDKAVPFEHSLQQTQLPALSYVYILRNSAHMGMLEEKDRSIEILSEVLQMAGTNK